MVKKAKVNSRYKVNMSVQAYDLAKAGSAMTIKVHERGRLFRDNRDWSRQLSLDASAGEIRPETYSVEKVVSRA
jgi:hypothetical protein